MAAQTAVGVTLTAIACHRPRNWFAAALYVLAVWLVVSVPMEANVLHDYRYSRHCG